MERGKKNARLGTDDVGSFGAAGAESFDGMLVVK
jgi:hypothetical protein